MRPGLFALLALFGTTLSAQLPPGQPWIGPGGLNYRHATVLTKGPYIAPEYAGDASYNYYIYEPADPTPASAPVVLLLPGFQVPSEAFYAGWITHLVRKGHTVVWARWDQGLITIDKFTEQAENSYRDALRRIAKKSDGHVPMAKDWLGRPLTAMTGHSAGAWLAAILAGRANMPGSTMPRPQAVVAFEPSGFVAADPMQWMDWSTKLLVVVGDDDGLVCDGGAKILWEKTAHLPDANRDYLVVRSDERTPGGMVAGHLFPLSLPFPNPLLGVDPLDYYGTYRYSTAAFQCGWYGWNCATALGNGAPEQTFMGLWSDGQPATPTLWVADPAGFTPACAQK
ncbi:MAG: hypothetical protein GC160_12040 [Acidobacteria bacterium]|nr:hypothetical protein [Acidobacteriota bacterium]